MNLKKFVEACNELPYICGWKAGMVELEESEENRVYVACDIHGNAVEPYALYTDLWTIINRSRGLFGSALISSEITENADDDTSPYRLILDVKYKRAEKRDSSNQRVIE